MVDFAVWVGVGAGPSLLSVDLLGAALRVYFDAPMTNNAAFVLPANDTLTPLAGGVAVTVTAVAAGPGATPSYAILDLNQYMTAGSLYQLTVDLSLEDAVGNSMDPGGITLSFLGLSLFQILCLFCAFTHPLDMRAAVDVDLSA